MSEETPQWKKVYSTGNLLEAELIKGMMEEAGIECVLMNKQISAYPGLGEIEIYVHEDVFLKARHLIETR